MTVEETSKLTGIPLSTLRRMRSRETRSLKSGPPYCKKMDKNGVPFYSYNKKDVLKWMKIVKSAKLTAGDAAEILQIDRDELLTIYGLKGFEVRSKEAKGRLIVDNIHNIYIWMPKK